MTQQYDHHIWDALRDLMPFVQFEKRKKRPFSSAVFGVAGGGLQL